MRFIISFMGGLIGAAATLFYYYWDFMGMPQQPPFEEYVVLMFSALFIMAIANVWSDGTEKNQAHISAQVAETYQMAKEAKETTSQLLKAIIDMQQAYNEQLQRIALGNDTNDGTDESIERGDMGGYRGHGHQR